MDKCKVTTDHPEGEPTRMVSQKLFDELSVQAGKCQAYDITIPIIKNLVSKLTETKMMSATEQQQRLMAAMQGRPY